MDERAVYAGVLLLLVAGSGVLVGAQPGPDTGPSPSVAAAGTRAYNVTDEGVRYTVHPSELVQGCPGGKDCIPAIDDPTFQPAAEAGWLRPGDLVIGVGIDGEAKAYPLRILTLHEVVNDELAGRPIAVTYCPLCRSGLVFSRRVDGRTLTFGVSGELLNANLVLYDRETGTYWSQIRGKAIVGPLVPAALSLHPSTITTWREWRRNHPDTLVLSRDTGIYPPSMYDSNPYAGYANSSRVGFGVTFVDDRLPKKALVYGVAVGNASTAYPETVVAKRDVINDAVGGVPLLVVERPDGGMAIFVRRVDNRTLRFERSGDVLVDRRGHRWSFDGRALDGPHEGATLERVPTHGMYWFAWNQFHPETAVYGNGTGS